MKNILTIISPDTGKKIQIAENDFKIKMNWDDATKACKSLGKGWRLPSIYEFEVIFNEFYLKDIGNFEDACYWTCNTRNEEEVWYYYFEDEEARANTFGKYADSCVRAVRDL